jgi:predicted DNA-binding transcriptional regulator AlpA
MTKALVGVHEIEEKFGLNRMQVYRLLRAGDFPAPEAELRHGRVWAEAKVERTVEKLRALGRINEQGIVVPWRFLDVERPRRRASA